ncbi:hypothetical protein R6Q59_014762, partial [Mikania micrantha]
IAQACRPVVKMAGLWESVRAVARGYEIVMGLIVFTPVALIARLPFVSEFQTHMLFVGLSKKLEARIRLVARSEKARIKLGSDNARL